MLVVLSPAKGQNFDSAALEIKCTEPRLLANSCELINTLRNYSANDLMSLMNVSEKIGALNADRFAAFNIPFNETNAKPAAFAFTGDVYKGLNIDEFNSDDLDYAQSHLRILSGLYGVLRPLDLIQPYRLEMGTKLNTHNATDLYEYWGTSISDLLMQDLKNMENNQIINLASNEYFKAIDGYDPQISVISPIFREWKNDKYKIISFFAKNARGTMAKWIVKNKIDRPEELIAFNEDGYTYSNEHSTADSPVFLRG